MKFYNTDKTHLLQIHEKTNQVCTLYLTVVFVLESVRTNTYWTDIHVQKLDDK